MIALLIWIYRIFLLFSIFMIILGIIMDGSTWIYYTIKRCEIKLELARWWIARKLKLVKCENYFRKKVLLDKVATKEEMIKCLVENGKIEEVKISDGETIEILHCEKCKLQCCDARRAAIKEIPEPVN